MSFGNLLLWGLPRQYSSNLDVLAALADLAALVAAPPRLIPPLFRCKSMNHDLSYSTRLGGPGRSSPLTKL